MLIVCSDMETLQKATHCKLMKQEMKLVYMKSYSQVYYTNTTSSRYR